MNITSKPFFATLALCARLLLTGCATSEPAARASYDLGTLNHAGDKQMQTRLQALNLPTFSLAEVDSPAWLDSRHMMYRLSYSNDQQAHAYAANRWAMTPAQLFQQRFTARLSDAGAGIVAAADGALNLPVLHLALDDFSQVFSSAADNHAHIAVRASLFDGRNLVAQKTFAAQIAGASADAQGGARALSQASDVVIDQIAAWLSKLPTKK
jgi:cholesterol transport system auxiliary component